MKSLISLLLLSVAITALAAPLTTPLITRDEPTYSYLKSQLIDGPERFDNLYVYSYHTGAGLSDAALDSSTEHAAKGFLNGSWWQFDLGNEFPWALNLGGDTNYAAWDPVTIDAGESRSSWGFYFNETAAPGLLSGYSSNGTYDYEHDEFKNWLVCDWSHGVPQLFWHYRYYNYTIPDTCAEVWLIPETCP